MDNKKTLLVWAFAILTNVAIIVYFAYNFLNTSRLTLTDFVAEYFTINHGIPSILVLAVLILLATFVSGINFKHRNYLGYGVPLAVFIYSIIDIFTCNGKFCSLSGLIGAACSIIFIIFFAAGIYLRKWSVKFIMTVIIIELIIFAVFAVLIFSRTSETRKLNDNIASINLQVEKATDVQTLVTLCDSYPMTPDGNDIDACWQKAVKSYPNNTKLCELSKIQYSKNFCNIYFELAQQD